MLTDIIWGYTTMDISIRLLHNWDLIKARDTKVGGQVSSSNYAHLRFGMLSPRNGGMSCNSCGELFDDRKLAKDHPCMYEVQFREYTGRLAQGNNKHNGKLAALELRVSDIERLLGIGENYEISSST